MRKLMITFSLCVFCFGITLAQNGSWDTTRTELPTQKWHYFSAVVDGKIYVIGGLQFTDSNLLNSMGVSSVEVFDPETNTWDLTKTPMPTPRGYGAIEVINGKIYVCGGLDSWDTPRLNVLEVYDPETDTWDTSRSPMPTKRHECRAAVLDNKLYVIGGLGGETPNPGKIIEVYNPNTDSWTSLPDLPTPVGSPSVDTLNNKIYVIGGIPTAGNPVNLIQTYNPDTNNWTIENTKLPIVCSHHASCASSGKIFILGGSGSMPTGYTWEMYNQFLMYDPLNESIQKLDNLPTINTGSTAHIINNHIYLIGGLNFTTDYRYLTDPIITDISVFSLPIFSKYGKINSRYHKLDESSVGITTQFNNPNSETISAMAKIAGLDIDFLDSLELFDDGFHHDNNVEDGTYGNRYSENLPEGFYIVDITSHISNSGIFFTTEKVAKFTTVGPLYLNRIDYTIDSVPNPGDNITIKPVLKNMGLSAVAGNVTAEIYSLDPNMAALSGHSFSFGHIIPGESKVSSTRQRKINISEQCPVSTILGFSIDISSNNYIYWRDTFQIKVGYGFISGIDDLILPNEVNISIFPNPTSGTINITGLTQPANIKIYNLQGQLLKSFQQVQQTIDLTDLDKGIYVMNIEVGDQRVVRKVVRE